MNRGDASDCSPTEVKATGSGLDVDRRRRAELLSVCAKMAGALVHRLRNPLAGVFVGLQTLEREAALSPEDALLLGLVINEIRTLDRIINEALDSTRFEALSPRPILIGRLVTAVIEALDGQASHRKVRLKTAPNSFDCEITVAEAAMTRALKHLAQNAIEASKLGDEVILGWRRLGRAEIEALFPGFQGDVVSIFGDDNGRGINIQLAQAASFAPFSTIGSAQTGLGLALAQDVIELHGGVLAMSRRPGGGTRFEAFLPAAAPLQAAEISGAECALGDQENSGSPYFDVEAGTPCLCWVARGRKLRADSGWQPDACTACPTFLRFNLAVFFRPAEGAAEH
jgi:two-component system sporulation sensor kinase B